MTIRFTIKNKVGTGNLVSNSERKVRRLYYPNIQFFKFYSEMFKIKLIIKCTVSFRNTIVKYGSIDRYLLLTKDRKLDSNLLKVKRKMIKKINSKIN